VSFLLDTNVVSETTKPRPNSGVVRWLEAADEDKTFLSVVTIAEIRYGIDRMPVGGRRNRIEEWFQADLPSRFEGKILPINPRVADACGRLWAHSEAIGKSISPMDALIAATAEVHGLTLVTRNTARFAHALQSILNPWI
jgi:predicted nucleic acid-binding protein